MKVLLLVRDLYKAVGGSETVYRKIIQANPDIDFVYFRVSESEGALRPQNATAVALQQVRAIRVAEPLFPDIRLENLQAADMYTRSVAGETFDIIEIPDYYTFGAFLRDCLAHSDVKFGAIVLAMHGNISTSLEMGWNSSGSVLSSLRALEHEQFVDADARYAVSMRGKKAWQARANFDVHMLDPLAMLVPVDCGEEWVGHLLRPAAKSPAALRPDLYCIGRMERLKGNDLFVEIVRWLDRELYGRAFHVGGVEYTRTGTSSTDILSAIARAREVDVQFRPTQDKEGLASIFGAKAVVLLPVRYDSLNLIALESLLSGCPTVISSEAGVCDYLDEKFPSLPYVKLDLANMYGVLPELEALLGNYEAYRNRLRERIIELKVKPGSLNLTSFYEDALKRGRQQGTAAKRRRTIKYRKRLSSLSNRVVAIAKQVVPQRVFQAAKKIARDPRAAFREWALGLGLFGDARLAWYGASSLKLARQYRRINLQGEGSPAAIDKKVRLIHAFGSGSIYRCNIWRELARLERLRGHELVAAAYELRLMRLLGGDVFGELPKVTASLEKNGFGQEALACKALYESPAHADRRAYEFLRAASARFRDDQPREWAMVDDRRNGNPRVAVIVSLYNAAPKLRLFLTALSRQSLVRENRVEIILADSGSKTDEYAVMKEFLASCNLSIVYARSQERETIQAAWNRGIHLARAPYLVFLGADETLYPEALEVLAAELDQNPSADWVMANSLVTEVDEHGVFKRDIMPYDRTGGTKDHAYLETCYVSWVGGMYRKSIHERFGYYDPSFRAAGDSEFKNRVFPHINVRFIPRTLGLFLNYPDDRTTASPTAEIEDTRAWYLHRTPGGVRYAFEGRGVKDALQLFYAALGYRKSYCRHISSDIEYSLYLLRYAIQKGSAPDFIEVERDLSGLLTDLRKIEWTERDFYRFSPALVLAQTWRDAGVFEKAHARRFRDKAVPTYRILNDNRFEQHTWLWDTSS